MNALIVLIGVYLHDTSLQVSNVLFFFMSGRQEPSLFAVAKLLETGLVNMDRIEILWRPLTAHLLEVAGALWPLGLQTEQ